MLPCRVNSCQLPRKYDEATEDEKAAFELNCWIVNSAEARECARRHERLADYISGGQGVLSK